jgi:NADH-quinone oxidoreductase subunit J
VVIELFYACVVVVALFSAMMVVLSPHAIHSALYLVLTMVSIAALFVLMNAQLAAALQIIVYAGAIMVLFLFVIMLLNPGRQRPPRIRARFSRWLGVALAGAFVVQMMAMLAMYTGAEGVAADAVPLASSISIEEVARLLLTDYIYAFEMTSVLLLIAVVGAIVLARRQTGEAPDEVGHRGAPLKRKV